MRTENQERDYEIQMALQKLYTAKRRLVLIAEGSKAWARALGAEDGVRDAAMAIFGEDVLSDINLDL